MEAYQERVVVEAQELEDKIIKLKGFIGGSEVFKEMERSDQMLLKLQLAQMNMYLETLGNRIVRFNKEAE